jgi:hypothetical protein
MVLVGETDVTPVHKDEPVRRTSANSVDDFRCVVFDIDDA